MEFLEVVESIRSEEASVQKLFGGEGRGARTIHKGPEYMRSLSEAAQFIAEVYQGRRPLHHLKEAMTTSDFPYLFGDILDRQLLAAYREAPATWQQVAVRKEVRDFREVKRFPRPTGGEAILTTVDEQEEYPAAAISEVAPYTYRVAKYGRRIPFSWETMVNDDLDALKDVPQRFGVAARATEQYFCTNLYIGTAGPDATFYASGNGNVITSNPALSITGLQTAMTVLGAMVSADGNPIVIEMATLEVPPALEVVANNIINATVARITTQGGASGYELEVANWMSRRLKVVPNPWIPIIADTNGNTSWFLHATPTAGAAAMEMGFLRGYAEPQIFMKAPNAQLVGGGQVNPMDGDFDTDSIQYKVRHVLGGTLLDPKLSVASNGTGA